MKRAIFIGGCDRSGTTMIADHIGVLPHVVVTPESQFKVPLLSMVSSGRVDEALSMLKSNFRFRLWDIVLDEERLRQKNDAKGFLFELVHQYAEAVGKPEWKVWVDHTPENLRYRDAMLGAFPDAKFVFAIRDGRAVAASVIPLEWGPDNAFHAGSWWAERNAFGLALLHYAPSSVLAVRFEDLLSGSDVFWRELLDHCNLPCDPAILQGGGFRVPEYTRKQHRLVGRGLDPSRIDAWRTGLAPREIELFEHAAGGLLSAFGYERLFDFPAAPTRKELSRFGSRHGGAGSGMVKRIRRRLRRAAGRRPEARHES